MKQRETKSPLKDKPLRRPGQSLLEERARIWEDKLEPWALASAFILAFTGLEWYRYLRPQSPSPLLFSALAVLIVALAVWRFIRWRPYMKSLRLGIDGERVVGEYLERMRENGFRVFHDVVAEGFNIDHVLIGPTGVYTVETKTISKPVRGDARIRYDGQALTVDGYTPDRDPIAQAEAQARWLSRLIADSIERKLFVQPVVVFPGWFIEPPAGPANVWVLEPKALPAFVDQRPQALSKEDVALIAKCVSMHVRAFERARDMKVPLV